MCYHETRSGSIQFLGATQAHLNELVKKPAQFTHTEPQDNDCTRTFNQYLRLSFRRWLRSENEYLYVAIKPACLAVSFEVKGEMPIDVLFLESSQKGKKTIYVFSVRAIVDGMSVRYLT